MLLESYLFLRVLYIYGIIRVLSFSSIFFSLLKISHITCRTSTGSYNLIPYCSNIDLPNNIVDQSRGI